MADPVNNNNSNDNNVTRLDERRILKANESTFRGLAGMLRRAILGRLTSFQGKRNYQEIFGWDSMITSDMMGYMYSRGGIAKRVVDSFPDAIWARPPALYIDGVDSFTQEWNDAFKDLDLWSVLHRLDRLAGLGHYAVLLIGVDSPGKLDTPLKKAGKITYLQPYSETSATIEEWDRVTTSPTFGKPLFYRIYPESGNGLTLSNTTAQNVKGSPSRPSMRVHASRILHVARGTLEDSIFGMPLMEPVWDYLTDLRKVVGSSSESYWISANRGLQADVDKDMALSAGDAADLQDEIDDFYNGFRRFIRTKGVKLETLNNDLADPKSPFEVLITLISGTSGIPKRILLGSEAGQLASTQDKGNWAERIEEERSLHTEPHILRPFIKRMVEIGIITAQDVQKVVTQWPDAYRMSPLERGQTQAQTARSVANIVKMLESESVAVQTLLSREEIRALLGFASDNRILADNPNP
jgi:hypothetical protein